MNDPTLAPVAPGATDAPLAPVFTIERIYVKDLSLENPNSPKSFLLTESPQIEVSLQTRGEPVGDSIFESVLTITVTAKVGEQTIFLVEVAQAGIFQLRNIPEADMQPILGIHCPNILFPYARENISSAITHAGYPPVHLAPINFEALYAQQLQQMQAAQPPGPGVSPIIQTTH
ncbi:MAG: protein-export chaperone SecB [Casimicrobiaceae bacterium]